jgi:formate hydrogenlyase subunit 6/NADH:ubiquinone oxidoreductase subunit I
MAQKFLKKDNFERFVNAIAETYILYYIEKDKKDNLHLTRYSGKFKNPVIGEVRPFEPLKNFFFYAREKVVDGYKKSEKVVDLGNKSFCILGVKNCDLVGFDILDHVFMKGDFEDPFYIRNRAYNLIIASDCTKAIDTCFCHAIGHQHYPERHNDILISEIKEGYLIKPVTDKGATFLDRHKELFSGATQKHIEEREHIRKHTGIEVEKNIEENEIPRYTDYKDMIKENLDSEIWEHEAELCVECGCCNAICPTCHCFYLVDVQKQQNKEVRYKIWDSCMYKRFAQVAGGTNPRVHLWMRLRNRFEKKFDFFPEVSGHYACTGCGRCFSGCPAKIDIRKILKELVAEKKAKFEQ